jgi:hypothetical protein
MVKANATLIMGISHRFTLDDLGYDGCEDTLTPWLGNQASMAARYLRFHVFQS